MEQLVVNTLWSRYFALLRFRAGPQDLPYAPSLLLLLLVLACALDIFGSSQIIGQDSQALWILLRVLIGMALLWALLQSAARGSRFVHTASALTVVGLVVTLLTLPLLWLVWPLPSDPQALSGAQAGLMFLTLPALVWFMSIRAFILRQALENHWLVAFFLAFALLVAETAITISLQQMVQ